MIFRKDNRGDSFQRQVTGLRKQLPSDEDLDTDDFRFEESQDSTTYTPAPAVPAREETFSTGRIVEDMTAAQSMPQPAQSFRSSWQSADAATSVIAASAHWNGTLRAEGSLHVHGRADGELHATNDVFIAEGAQVDAQIFADTVVVAGLVRGKIEARTRLELLPQGHVAGDVKSPKLVVQEGARLSGQLTMEGGNGGAALTSSTSAAKQRRSSQ